MSKFDNEKLGPQHIDSWQVKDLTGYHGPIDDAEYQIVINREYRYNVELWCYVANSIDEIRAARYGG